MARYGSFRYSEAKYGASTDSLYLWTFIVAWDGSYSGENEALRMVDLSVRRGRENMLQTGAGGFERMQPGAAVAICDNADGRYDPWNTDSPLYPHVRPGKFCRILVQDGPTGTNYGVMRGVIDDIQPLMRNGIPHVQIRIKDAISWLRGKLVDTNLVTDDPVYTAIEQILNDSNAQWPTAEWPWSIGGVKTAADDLTYPYWDAWRQDALEAVREVEEAEIGIFFHAKDGKAKWRNRDYAYDASKDVTQDIILRDIAIQQPWENIRNDVRIGVNKRIETPPVAETVWALQGTVPLAAGESFDVWMLFRYSSFPAALGSVGFNFAVNTAADGSGVDLTGSCSISRLVTEPGSGGTEFSEGVGVRVTNGSASDGYIIQLEAWGDPIYIPYNETRNALDSDSVEGYGGRALTINSRWMQDYDVAQAIADWLVDSLSDPIPAPIIQFENRPAYQFYLDLWDRVRLLIGKYGIYDIYRVGSIEHRWLKENGQAVRTTMRLEPFMQYGSISEKIFIGCLLSTTGPAAISHDTWTAVTYGQELIDPWGFHSSSNYYITVPPGFEGYYMIFGTWPWDSSGSDGFVRLKLILNGVEIANVINEMPASGQLTQQIQIQTHLSGGDTLSLWAYQYTGGALDMLHSDAPYYPLFGLYQLDAGR